MKLESHSLTDVSPYPCVAIPVITIIRPTSTFNQEEAATSTAERYPGGQLVKLSLALWGPYDLKSLLKAEGATSWLSSILPSQIPSGSKQLTNYEKKTLMLLIKTNLTKVKNSFWNWKCVTCDVNGFSFIF